VKGNLRSALRHRDFRWLWLGQSASSLGDQLSVVAIAALVIGAGHGASGLGLVLAGRSLALVLFMVAGGIVGDRAQRTHVMLAADAVRVLAVAALALARRSSSPPIARYSRRSCPTRSSRPATRSPPWLARSPSWRDRRWPAS
jgi:MFS family permease